MKKKQHLIDIKIPRVQENSWLPPPSPHHHQMLLYSKTCLKQPLKRKTKIGFQDRLSLNAGQKYCRMLPWEHSAILLTFIKLQFVIKTFVLSIFEWPFYTGFIAIFPLHCSDDDNNYGGL